MAKSNSKDRRKRAGETHPRVLAVRPHKRVALLIETSTSWGRRLIEGIGNYARQQGPWEFYIEARGINEHIELPAGWDGDGVIARIHTPALAKQLQRRKLPTVNVSSSDAAGKLFPRALVDERVIAQLMFDHLRERGFVNFAYCGESKMSVIRTRAAIFEDVVRRAGFTCNVYEGAVDPHGYALAQDDRARWLSSLPKPVGVVCWNAVAARRTAEACRWGDIHIPEDVALVAGSSDDLMIEMVHPPITAAELPLERLGYQAALMLDQMIQTGKRADNSLISEDVTIAARQSTDVLAIDDPPIREALRFIREHAGEPVGVPDVLEHVAVSRRVLERQFRLLLGRSPAHEIRRMHVERAKQLLVQTNLSVAQVAAASGFRFVERLIPVFRKYVGTTPLKYRKRMRPA